MSIFTTVRSWSAIAVATFFFGLTCYVVFEDVLRHGAPITTKHLLSFGVLVGTVYFGHAFLPQVKTWQMGKAFGCAVLFAGGTLFCVIMAAGRNAETVLNKADDTRSANTERHRLANELVTAKASFKAIVEADDLTLKEARLRYKAALTAEESECSDGQGGRCLKRRAVTAERRKDVDAAEKTRRDTIEMHRQDAADAEAKLAKLPPERVPNAEYRAAAELLAKLPYVTAPVSAIEALLLVLEPFLKALFCEIATIVGFSMGLGHKPRVPATLPQAPVLPVQLPGPPVIEAQPHATLPQPACNVAHMSKQEVLAHVRLHLHTHATLPSQSALARQTGVNKGTIHRWLREWESAGLLVQTKVGRCKQIEQRPFRETPTLTVIDGGQS